MKKIACVGYNFTGSGVIDDIFRECDNVCQGEYEAECRVLQDPDGVSDLEFHLVECPNRLKTGIAIERFMRFAKDQRRMYQKVFGNDWLSMCQEYIDSITKFEFQGYHSWQLMARKPHIRYVIYCNKVINKLKPKPFRHPWWFNYFPNATEFHASINEKEFLEKTQIYMEKLCTKLQNDNHKEFVLLDQLIAPNYPERYLRYVSDLKVIIVDRDPRDLYIFLKNLNGHTTPKDPHEFCIHYRDLRKIKGTIDKNRVLYINFEDLIYKYDEMVSKVLEFVGIDKIHHVAPKTHFNPAESIKNTKLWEKNHEYDDAIAIIEKELPEFLHNY